MAVSLFFAKCRVFHRKNCNLARKGDVFFLGLILQRHQERGRWRKDFYEPQNI